MKKQLLLTIFLSIAMFLSIQTKAQNAKWTWMVYLYEDGTGLDGADDFNELEANGSTDDVNYLILYDSDNDSEDGVYLVEKDGNGYDGTIISSIVYSGLGTDPDMNDWNTLKNFILWVESNYPADHYGLNVWDHGSGIFKNETTSGINKGCVGDMKLWEIDKALAAFKTAAGQKLDIVGFDVCLLGQIETAYQIKDYTNYVIASEKTEPGDGWDYEAGFAGLNANPSISAATLATNIVDAYVNFYTSDITQAATDISSLETNLIPALNTFSTELINALGDHAEKIVNAINNAWVSSYEQEHHDLGHFAQLIHDDATLPSSLITAANNLLTAYNTTIIAEGHVGSGTTNATGLKMWMPLDYSTNAEHTKYSDTTNYLTFSKTNWDEFLTALENASFYCPSNGNMSFETSTTLVNFNTINNATTKPAGYNDYTNLSTDVIIGESYDLTVNVNTDGSYTLATKVWIDWNQDKDFSDAGEEYDLGTANNVEDGPTSNSPLSITVPDVATGSTRMRVSTKYSSAATACQTNFDGEVEDYTINVSSGTSPFISISPSSLNFGNVLINYSAESSYTVSGSNLTEDVVITSPTNFEISTTSGSNFGSSITLTQTDGSIADTTIYVNFTPTAAESYSASITHVSSGATTKNLTVSGTGSDETVLPPRNLTATENSGDVDLAWNAPFDEGFEGSWSPTGWSIKKNTASDGGLNGNNLRDKVDADTTWNQIDESSFGGSDPEYIHTGTYSAGLGYNAPDFNWLITPTITVQTNEYLKFWLWYASINNGNDTIWVTKFNVLINDAGSWTNLLEYGDGTPNNEYETQISIDLSSYEGHDVQFAFVFEYNDGFQLMIDDVTIEKGSKIAKSNTDKHSATTERYAQIINKIDKNTKSTNVVSGYKVYKNEALINTITDISQKTYTDESVCGEHNYHVTAIYSSPSGESDSSNIANIYVSCGVITTSLSNLPDFGDVVTETISSEKSYTVEGAELTDDIIITTADGFEISETSGSGFGSSITLTQTAGSVPNTTIYVRFAPTEVKAYSGNITHISSGATQMDVALTGNSVNHPEITSSLNSINFGDVVSGSTSVEQTYTVKGDYLNENIVLNAPANFEISETSGSGFGSTITLTQTDGSVETTTIYVRFLPDAVQTFSGDITHTTAGATQVDVALSGSGVAPGTPIVTATKTSLDFGVQYIETTSSEQTYTIEGSDLSENIVLTAPTDFEISETSGSGFGSSVTLTQTAGSVANTTIYVRFVPTEAKVYSGNITHTSADATQVDIALTGNSINPPEITASLTSLNFGDVITETTSGEKTYTVEGVYLTEDISITAPAGFEISTTSGAAFASSLSLTQTDGSVANTTIYVQFAPTEVKAYDGNITHTSTDAPQVDIALTGNSVNPPEITASLSNLNFGDVITETTSGEKTYTVEGAYLTEDISVIAPAGFEISTTSGSNFASSLTLTQIDGSVENTTIYVRFAPTEVKAYDGNITHTSTDAPQVDIALTGNSVNPPEITASISSYDFGDVITETTSSKKSYTIEGIYLTEDIEITAPTGFEISKTSGSGFGSSLTLTQIDGVVANTTVYVRFIPTEVKAYDGNITHTSTVAPQVDVALTGNSVNPPEITASISSLNFGDVITETTSGEKTYTIEGAYLTEDISITAPAGFEISKTSGADFASSLTLTQTDGSVASTIIYVRFAPTEIKAYEGNITHTSTVAPQVDIALTGNSVNTPKITASLISMDFGDVENETTSSYKTYAIEGKYLIEDIALNAATGFKISTTRDSGFASSLTLTQTDGSVANTIIYVRFAPTEVKVYSGNITHTSASAPQVDIALTGNSVNTPEITVSLNNLDFGNVVTETTSAEKDFTIEGNNLTEDIVLNAPDGFEISTISGSDFDNSLTLTQTDGSVANIIIYVRFVPTEVKAYDGNITITSASATEVDVALTGNSVTTGINETNISEEQINIYPNPSSGKFTLDVKGQLNSSISVIVKNITGKTILKKSFDSSNNNRIDLTGNSAGIYFLQIEINKQFINTQVVIK